MNTKPIIEEAARAIEKACGCAISLLSEADEAHLGFVGASSKDALDNGALVDIGGGSSEVTLVVGGVDAMRSSLLHGLDAPSPAFAPPYRATAPFFPSRSNQERKQLDSQESSKIPGRKAP